MKSILVCASVSHGNTRRVAEAMAEILEAEVVAPEEADPAELAGAGLVGFGSGVFFQRLHPRLTEFVKGLPSGQEPHGRAFVFATSGFPEVPPIPFTRPLVRLLEGKGYEVAGTFSCRARDTMPPFQLFGGVNKRRPNADDLVAARAFATRLRDGAEPAT